jgi:peptidyl-prolyl cis-trans isomerase B (cyclophilin B)
VASSKSRQRKIARAKVERQLVRRAHKARRRRQTQAGVAIGVVVLVLLFGALYLGGVFSSDKKKTTAADCLWTSTGTSSVQGIAQPPTTGIVKSGTDTLTIDTNLGRISATIDRAKTPCTAASLSYLAGKGFYNNTKCSRLTTADMYLLYCGDPVGDGSGTPGYTSVDENVPAADPVDPSASAAPSASASASPDPEATGKYTYPRGTVVMAQTGGPNTNGSQFFIVYKDTKLPATYTVLGTVTAGMDLVEKVAAGGVAAGGKSATDGPPNTAVTITALTVGTPPDPSAAPSAAPSTSPTASSSAAPAASS